MTPATKSSAYFPPLLFIALSNFLHPASQHTPSESTIMLPRKKRKKNPVYLSRSISFEIQFGTSFEIQFRTFIIYVKKKVRVNIYYWTVDMSWIPHILQHRRQTQPKCTILSRLERAMRSPDRGLRRRFYNKPYLQEEFVCIWIWLQRIWWEPLSWIWRVWGNPGWSWCSAVCTPRPEKQWTNRRLWTSKTCINWKKVMKNWLSRKQKWSLFDFTFDFC